MKNWTVLDSQNIAVRYLRLPEGETPSGPVVEGLGPFGFEYKEGSWVKPAPVIRARPVRVTSVSPAQARLALLAKGDLDKVQTALNALPEPEKTAAFIKWEYSTEIERANPLVERMRVILGYSPDQMDALFMLASKL